MIENNQFKTLESFDIINTQTKKAECSAWGHNVVSVISVLKCNTSGKMEVYEKTKIRAH